MSSLSDFLGEIGRHQLLTPERELTMGRKVQEMVVLVNRCQEAGGNWLKGWINLPKLQSITEEYVDFKSLKKGESIDEIFINEDSLFNIS